MEDAARLVSRGVIQLADVSRPAVVPFLGVAAQLRTPEALQEILDVLFAQHIVGVGAHMPTSWRAFDGAVGPRQADSVPVFDRA